MANGPHSSLISRMCLVAKNSSSPSPSILLLLLRYPLQILKAQRITFREISLRPRTPARTSPHNCKPCTDRNSLRPTPFAIDEKRALAATTHLRHLPTFRLKSHRDSLLKPAACHKSRAVASRPTRSSSCRTPPIRSVCTLPRVPDPKFKTRPPPFLKISPMGTNTQHLDIPSRAH